MKLCNAEGEIKEDISETLQLNNFTSGGSLHNFVCTIHQPIESGDYICLMYKSVDSDTWQTVIGGGDTTAKIAADTSPTSIVSITSPVISIENVGQEIMLNSDSPMTHIKLYTSTGMLLEQNALGGEYSNRVSMAHLPKGIYLVQIETIYGISKHKVVNH